MKDATRRTLRTAYQVVVAVITFVPVILPLLPIELSTNEAILTFGVWVAIVTRTHNALEDAGLIPDWLNVKREADPAVDLHRDPKDF